MFWKVSGLSTASPVDSILDKESYSLEELLDEDELIQECKSLNARLTAFLKQKETVEKLVRYLVEPPPKDADPKRSFKYPFTACEIFCCEVEGIFNTLLENEDVLSQLFSLLEAPRPLNCMLAGYFSRVMGSLLLRRTQDIMQYLQKHQQLLLQLVEHVDTTSIAEVLVRLVGADEQRAFLSTNHLQWLSETNLLYLLLDKLQPGQPVEAQSNAAEILAALAQSQVSPLTKNLAEPQFLELLVERALRHPGQDGSAADDNSAAQTEQGISMMGSSSAMMHALNVCIALVEPLPHSTAEQQAAAQGLGLGGIPTPAIDAAAVEIHAAMRGQAIQCISKSIDRLVALLDAVDAERQLPTSYGLLQPPVGLARLKAVELLAALLQTGEEPAESAVMGTQGVQRCMELFLQFPFNNVLHRHVTTLLLALDKGSPRLATFLLQDCQLLKWLVEVPMEVTPVPRPGQAPPEGRKSLRAGYAGHVTQISNRLLQLADEGHEQLRPAMEADSNWQQYVKDRLEPRNAQENVFAWKCGRPAVHEPVVDAEADMFQTELDFGSMESEAFTRDVYQRYSVFSSHEDEEVDNEQPQWAMELASASGVLSAGAGKLPTAGPQPFPVYDSSSSSEEDSDDDHMQMCGSDSSATSDDAEVSVMPAPESDLLLVNSAAVGAQAAPAEQRPPLSSDDADMADDAVMLEYDAAEQLVSLSQLSLEDNAPAPAEQSQAAASGQPEGQQQQVDAAHGGGQPAATAQLVPVQLSGEDTGAQQAAAAADGPPMPTDAFFSTEAWTPAVEAKLDDTAA